VIRQLLLSWCFSLLEGGQHVVVQGASLASEEIRVNGLSRERMTKGESIVSFFYDELRRDQLLNQNQQVTFCNVEN
jgi:hypothetical protein